MRRVDGCEGVIDVNKEDPSLMLSEKGSIKSRLEALLKQTVYIYLISLPSDISRLLRLVERPLHRYNQSSSSHHNIHYSSSFFFFCLLAYPTVKELPVTCSYCSLPFFIAQYILYLFY
jgi:hypothetical protein